MLFYSPAGYGLVTVVRVAEIETGRVEPFEITVTSRAGGSWWNSLGRSRWMPDGRIAFVGESPDGRMGVYVQDFVPGRDTTSTRRPLAGFDPDRVTESFGISADGTRIILSMADQVESLVLAEGVPGVTVPGRKP